MGVLNKFCQTRDFFFGNWMSKSYLFLQNIGNSFSSGEKTEVKTGKNEIFVIFFSKNLIGLFY